MYLIDTHAHIYSEYFSNIDDIINQAKSKGVKKIICIGTDLKTSQDSINIAEKYDNVFCTVGIHPHDAKDAPPNYIKELEQLGSHNKVVAIGEMGLDFFYKHSNKNIQIKVFTDQLELSNDLGFPSVIHMRDAFEDTIQCIKKTKLNKGVVHCFTGNSYEAKQLLNLNLLLSFTGIITFSKELSETVKTVPIDKIMIETDSPYLAPVPNRGKKNQPLYLPLIAKKIAEIKDRSYDEICIHTTRNAIKFFNLDEK